MTEREWSIEEIIEALRQWDSAFYSDSETKWLMSKAADALTAHNWSEYMIDEKWLLNYIDALQEDTPSQVLSRLALINMVAAWQKEQASRTNELDTIRQ